MVRVVLRAEQTAFATPLADGTIRVRVHAPPVDGLANEELLRFLAKAWGVPRRALSITSGVRARTKRIRIDETKNPGI